MQKNQRGFLIVLCICLLSVPGIYGAYRYRSGLSEEPENTASLEEEQPEEIPEQQTEEANSGEAVAKADTDAKEETSEAKVETEEDLEEIGVAEFAQSEEEEQPEEEPEESTPTAAAAQSELFAFSEDSTLLWPVDGDVILKYSMDKSIYFSTLNQYKYHPAIVVSAELGSEVQCAARGTVSEIVFDEETGTTLTMDLGSGYEAIYGQLDDVAVEEGDTVEAGELLGYVAEPTKYYTLEGSNLYFQLLKDEEAVDPLDYLE